MTQIRALLVGEARGFKEAQFHHGFVGKSGQELIRMLGESGLGPELRVRCRACDSSVVFGRCSLCGAYNSINELEAVRYWAKARSDGIAITNVFHERPADDNDNVELFFGKKTDEGVDLTLPPYKRGSSNFYIKTQYRHYIDDLHREIAGLKPNLIVLLGNTACWAVIQQSGIGNIRGTVQTSPHGRCLPTYHPAALRAWELRPILVADLKKAKTEAEINYLYRRPRWIIKNPTIDEITSWLRRPKSYYAVDIESGWALWDRAEMNRMRKLSPSSVKLLASQISIVGFARSPTDALVIPLMTRESPTLSYWGRNEEPIVWDLIQKGLSAPVPKIFQNGMYDISRLIAYTFRPTMCYEDTMLMQHSFYPEMLKSLGFLGSIHLREISWKQMRANGESLKRDD